MSVCPDLHFIRVHITYAQEVPVSVFSLSEVIILLQTENPEQDASDSHFMGLVRNLLRDPDERRNFFQVRSKRGCFLEKPDLTN